MSYLTAPLFDEARAVYEIQLGPLQPAVSRAQRDQYIVEIRAAAEKLSTA